MNFEELTNLMEARFRDLGENTHIDDVPMFSIFVDSELWRSKKDIRMMWMLSEDEIYKAFANARKEIHKIGFPTQHVNVVFRDFRNDRRQKGDTENVQGYAYGNPDGTKLSASGKRYSTPHIGLPYTKIVDLAVNRTKGKETKIIGERLTETIVHEWGHIWMNNNSQGFRDAVKKYYDNIYDSQEELLHKSKMVPDFQKHITKFFADMRHLFQTLLTYENYSKKKVQIFVSKRLDYLEKDLKVDLNLGSYKTHVAYNIQGLIFHYLNMEAQSPELKQRAFEISIKKAEDEYRAQMEERAKTETSFTMNKREVGHELSRLVKWVSGYGMINHKEMWATGMERFAKLEPYHKKRILEIMATTGQRELPNRTQRKHLK